MADIIEASFDVAFHHPLRGGLATFDERLAAEFNQQGYNAIIYTFSLQYPGFLFPGKSQFSNTSAPEGLKIERIVNSINPFNWISVGRKIKKLPVERCDRTG